MDNPKVSVIIPFFNGETFLEETLCSIKGQTYSNWECVLVDDGSTDGSVDIIKSFAESDERFKLVIRDRGPKGAPTCRNIGFLKSEGDFINWFDADDLMHPEMLSKKVELLSANPIWDFVVARCASFQNSSDQDLVELHYVLQSDRQIRDYLSFKLRFYTPGPLFRKSFLDTQDYLFDEKLSRHQEGEFYFRLLHHSNSYGIIDEPLALIRKHEDSLGAGYSHQAQSLRNQNDHMFDFKILNFALKENMIRGGAIDPFYQLALRYFKRSCRLGWYQFMNGTKMLSNVIRKKETLWERFFAHFLIPFRTIKYLFSRE